MSVADREGVMADKPWYDNIYYVAALWIGCLGFVVLFFVTLRSLAGD